MDASPALEPALYQAIVEQIPDAVVVADREGLIRIWNDGACSVFGFAASEVIGRSLDMIVPERLREAHWRGFDRALENGRTAYGNEVRVTRALHKDGRRLYVELSFGLVVDRDGAVFGALAIGRDCTERYLADKALRARLAELGKQGA